MICYFSHEGVGYFFREDILNDIISVKDQTTGDVENLPCIRKLGMGLLLLEIWSLFVHLGRKGSLKLRVAV